MKKFLALLALNTCLLLGALPSTAAPAEKVSAERAPRHMAVTIDPIRWAFGTYIHQMEMAFSEKLALTIPLFGIVPKWSFFRGAAVDNLWLVGAGAGLKYYFAGKALSHGAYIHPQVTLSAGKGGASIIPSSTDDAVFALAGSYGVAAGYTWVADNGFLLDAYAGFTHLVLFTAPPAALGAGDHAGITGINPYVGLLIGYSW